MFRPGARSAGSAPIVAAMEMNDLRLGPAEMGAPRDANSSSRAMSSSEWAAFFMKPSPGSNTTLCVERPHFVARSRAACHSSSHVFDDVAVGTARGVGEPAHLGHRTARVHENQ